MIDFPLGPRPAFVVALVGAFFAAAAGSAFALDKQGAAHRGGATAGAEEIGLSGQVFAGLMPYNPTYAATPDNRGHSLLRWGGHLDVDIPALRLFLPLDLNVFSDRDRSALRKLAPSEVDLIGGVATTTPMPGGSGELAARVEWDRAADGGAAAQHYGDLRARYMVATTSGALSGWATFGWFFWNPSYFARPDNTGRALLRYIAHAAATDVARGLSLVLDGNAFTDRTASWFGPSEIDLTVAALWDIRAFEVQLAYERDMPVDRRGLIQHMALLSASWSFQGGAPPPPVPAEVPLQGEDAH